MRTSRSGNGVWNRTNIALFILVVTFSTSLSALVLPLPGDLPPDPGIGGEAAIEGVDVNNNGVRDDVELAIFDSYPNNPGAREILYHMAIYYQTLLIHRQTASVVLDSVGYLVALAPCLQSATNSSSVADMMLRPAMLNTYDRGIAYITAMRVMENDVTIPARTVICSVLPAFPIVPPGTPSSIIVPANSATLIYPISWGAAIGTVTRYDLQRDTSTGFTAPVSAYTGTALTSNVTATQNATYYHRVRACNNDGCSNWRTGANGVVVAAPPGIPSSITVPLSSTTGSYTISWGAASGAVTRYELTETLIPTFCSTWPCKSILTQPVMLYTGTAAQYLIIGKTSGTYSYSVRACNDIACSDSRIGPTTTVSIPTVFQPPRFKIF